MLKAIPTNAHLGRLYFELSKEGASCVGEMKPWPYSPRGLEELLCLAFDMSRYDPRLITVLVRFLAEKWPLLNPAKIRAGYRSMNTPQTVGVISEFVLRHADLPPEAKYFFEYLKAGMGPVPAQFYFHHLYAPGGFLAERAAQMSLAEYKRWGFLANEAPVLDEKTRMQVGTLDADARNNVLKKLLSGRVEIKLSDYITACGDKISRQQALIDVKNSGLARMKGRGKGARWIPLAQKGKGA